MTGADEGTDPDGILETSSRPGRAVSGAEPHFLLFASPNEIGADQMSGSVKR